MFKSFITIVATLAVSGFVHAQDAVQWTQAEGGNGHWYSVEPTDRISWLDSQQLAENRGGYMITMLSAEENQFFCDTFCDLPNLDIPGYRGFWMGLRYENSEWNWQTGEPFSYSNFASNGQDNLPAAQYAVFEKDGEWGNEDGNYPEFNPVWLAVEYSADCNGDGIVDYGQILDGSLDDVNGNGIPDSCDLEGLSDPIQWSESEGGNGHWYAYVQSASPSCWETDREMAEGMGGYLATITNEAENSFLGQLAQPFYPLSAAANIGGYQDLETPIIPNPAAPGSG